jgi:hypothetical protein
MDVWPSAQQRLNLPRLCVRLRKYHRKRQPKGFEFESCLPSQIYPLRAFSAFWLTARQASTPQNGQYLRSKDTLCGRSGLGYSPRMPRRRWFGSTFSDSPARDELLVNLDSSFCLITRAARAQFQVICLNHALTVN